MRDDAGPRLDAEEVDVPPVARRVEGDGRQVEVAGDALELTEAAEHGLTAPQLERAPRLGQPRDELRVERAAVATLGQDQRVERLERLQRRLDHGGAGALAPGRADPAPHGIGARQTVDERDGVGLAQGREDAARHGDGLPEDVRGALRPDPRREHLEVEGAQGLCEAAAEGAGLAGERVVPRGGARRGRRARAVGGGAARGAAPG